MHDILDIQSFYQYITTAINAIQLSLMSTNTIVYLNNDASLVLHGIDLPGDMLWDQLLIDLGASLSLFFWPVSRGEVEVGA